ncbi:MAG: bile acid:sodium symporter, partial [Gloeomargarita sp. DG02_3_bins_56]
MKAVAPLGIFERYLSLWVALCIIAGVKLGLALPGLFELIAGLQYANVNFVVAVLIWVMIYPMMVSVDFASIREVGRKPKGLCITLVVNWLVKPFTMALLGILFFNYLFAGWVTPAAAKEYIAGMILLGAAPCTAMVFVWSQLVRGDANYTLVQVSINDLIMVVAFAPIVSFLLGVTAVQVPWETLLLSVLLYVVIPLAAGYWTRKRLDRVGHEVAIARFCAQIKPYSIVGLLATVVLLFGFQA